MNMFKSAFPCSVKEDEDSEEEFLLSLIEQDHDSAQNGCDLIFENDHMDSVLPF